MLVLVDSCVLLDVAHEDPRFAAASAALLERLGDRHQLMINPLIFAEVSVRYTRPADVDRALPPDVFRREPLPFDAAFLAGKAFVAYRRRGGTRTSPLTDFFIGAHAAVAGAAIATRDVVRYRQYFPTVTLLTPE